MGKSAIVPLLEKNLDLNFLIIAIKGHKSGFIMTKCQFSQLFWEVLHDPNEFLSKFLFIPNKTLSFYLEILNIL